MNKGGKGGSNPFMAQQQVSEGDGTTVAEAPIDLFFTDGRMLDSEGATVTSIGTTSHTAKLGSQSSGIGNISHTAQLGPRSSEIGDTSHTAKLNLGSNTEQLHR